MATMLRTQTGSGTQTLTAEEAADYDGLQIVSLAGRQGFSSNARVYGFGGGNATATRTRPSTGSYALAQPSTETYTQTQTRIPPQTQTITQPQTQPKTGAGTQTQPRAQAQTSTSTTVETRTRSTSLIKWFKKLRLKILATANKRRQKSKSKPAKKKPVDKKPTHQKSAKDKPAKNDMNPWHTGTQQRLRSNITTIHDIAADTPVQGSYPSTRGKGKREGELQRERWTKSRVMTIKDLLPGAPGPDPGDPGRGSTNAVQNESGARVKKTDESLTSSSTEGTSKEKRKARCFICCGC